MQEADTHFYQHFNKIPSPPKLRKMYKFRKLICVFIRICILSCELDIPLCSRDEEKCPQNCTDTPGSYLCSCFDGYSSNDNGYTCNRKTCMHMSRINVWGGFPYFIHFVMCRTCSDLWKCVCPWRVHCPGNLHLWFRMDRIHVQHRWFSQFRYSVPVLINFSTNTYYHSSCFAFAYSVHTYTASIYISCFNKLVCWLHL